MSFTVLSLPNSGFHYYLEILDFLTDTELISVIYIYIYAFSRRFYPKQLTVHSGYNCFYQYVCFLGIEPTTFALLMQCSTTEPQEHYLDYKMDICFLHSMLHVIFDLKKDFVEIWI